VPPSIRLYSRQVALQTAWLVSDLLCVFYHLKSNRGMMVLSNDNLTGEKHGHGLILDARLQSIAPTDSRAARIERVHG